MSDVIEFPEATPPEYVVDHGPAKYICQRCGAKVADTDTHTEWHVNLTQAIHDLCDSAIELGRILEDSVTNEYKAAALTVAAMVKKAEDEG